MKEEIIAMLNDMNEEQLQRVLDYVTNEYDEENFEEHSLNMLKKLQVETTLEKLKYALSSRADFPKESMEIVKETCDSIIKG